MIFTGVLFHFDWKLGVSAANAPAHGLQRGLVPALLETLGFLVLLVLLVKLASLATPGTVAGGESEGGDR